MLFPYNPKPCSCIGATPHHLYFILIVMCNPNCTGEETPSQKKKNVYTYTYIKMTVQNQVGIKQTQWINNSKSHPLPKQTMKRTTTGANQNRLVD